MSTKKPAKKTAKKSPAKAKLEQRPVTLSASRPKKSLASTQALPSKVSVKKAAPKKKSKPKVKVESRPVTLSAPRPKKPARKPAAELQPVTIAPARDSAPAPYYFAPMVGYFDEAISAQDLRERMLFRRTLGNHPEDVLVAGERKARAMGWNLDAIEVEPPVAASANAPAPETLADAPAELTTPTNEPEQSIEAASEAAEVPAVEPAQPEASTAEPAQPAAPEPEPALAATVPEHQEEAAS
jgi:hypothetical protein